jgi:hypothetical protein
VSRDKSELNAGSYRSRNLPVRRQRGARPTAPRDLGDSGLGRSRRNLVLYLPVDEPLRHERLVNSAAAPRPDSPAIETCASHVENCSRLNCPIRSLSVGAKVPASIQRGFLMHTVLSRRHFATGCAGLDFETGSACRNSLPRRLSRVLCSNLHHSCAL